MKQGVINKYTPTTGLSLCPCPGNVVLVFTQSKRVVFFIETLAFSLTLHCKRLEVLLVKGCQRAWPLYDWTWTMTYVQISDLAARAS